MSTGKVVQALGGTFFQTAGIVERLETAKKKAASKTPEAANTILAAAIDAELTLIRKITDMPGFRAWIDGERINMSTARKG